MNDVHYEIKANSSVNNVSVCYLFVCVYDYQSSQQFNTLLYIVNVTYSLIYAKNLSR